MSPPSPNSHLIRRASHHHHHHHQPSAFSPVSRHRLQEPATPPSPVAPPRGPHGLEQPPSFMWPPPRLYLPCPPHETARRPPSPETARDAGEFKKTHALKVERTFILYIVVILTLE